MPWTLWRHTFIQLAKLIALSTAVLVVVIAFAATVKPLADGKLTPAEALRFMFLAIPPMLAYALPFSACFATTLTYHRMTTDNEITAAKAGGLSHQSILMPALVMGLVLAVGLGALNEQVIPRFLRSMESMITRNLIQMMVRTMERGEAAEFADLEIYADRIRRVRPAPGSGVIDQYVMKGVTAIAFGDNGRVETDVSAQQAHLWLAPASVAGIDDSDQAVALIRFEDLVYADQGDLLQQDEFTTTPVRVPSPFEDDPKFLTFGQLRALKRHPEHMNWIDAQRLELARRVAARDALASIVRALRDDGDVRFEDPMGQVVVVRSSGFASDGWQLLPAEGSDRIEIEISSPDRAGTDRLAAASARLQTESPEIDPTRPIDRSSLSFSLSLTNVLLRSAAGLDLESDTGQTEIPQRVLRGLRPAQDTLSRLQSMTAAQVLSESEAAIQRYGTGTEAIARAADRLRKSIASLKREILSKQHERFAMTTSCLVMVLTGAVTALRLRDRLPLIVYLWSFFPALITIIMINTGQQVTHGTGLIGLPLLWGGVAGLIIYTFAAFRIVARH